MPIQSFFATCPRGFETLLCEELSLLKAVNIRETQAGAHFDGDQELMYRVCLWSRLANKILFPLCDGSVPDNDALYKLANSFAWEEHFEQGKTFRIDFFGTNQLIRHSNYGALAVKDAIVDRLREKFGERPSVNRDNPDLIINARLTKGNLHLALDLSGDSLHKRGYRVAQGGAPLKENLAAALLLRAGWPEIARRGGALLDPMCGSATFLIEAALMAADIAPGLLRNQFGFNHWKQFDRDLFMTVKDEALERERQGLEKEIPEIRGYDIDARMVVKAEENIHAAGLEKLVRVSQKALEDFVKPSHKKLEDGLIICNPPYGERLGEVEELKSTYQQLASVLKREVPGWRFGLFTGNTELAKETRLRSSKKYRFFNGAIASELLLFDLLDESKAHLKTVVQEAAPAYAAKAYGKIPGTSVYGAANREQEKSGGELKGAVTEGVSEGVKMLVNRLKKNKNRLGSWLKREQVECYRIYDADIPEYSAAIDVYGEHLHVQEYAAPASIDPQKAEHRFGEILRACVLAFEVESSNVHAKQRKRNKGKQQYEKQYSGKLDQQHFFEVNEGQARLLVNMQDYLDTGLFLDHRPLRLQIAQQARGKSFLNLFCYTATASVHAALGGAKSSLSVDMSNTYLDWGKRNFELNNVHKDRHKLERADCFNWLDKCRQGFDIILLDPPSFSNSKKMSAVLDIQKDHERLISRCMDVLTPGGVLYFSNNLRSFKLSEKVSERFKLENISRQTLDPDFEKNPRIHQCWKISSK